jgi:serine/threonine-protein kinase
LAGAGTSLRSGDELGSYQLLVPIGAGGMGRVWVAREVGTPELGAPALTRLVAIKTALAEDGASEAFYKVLFDEARIASLVQHPNVCVIHGAERARGIVFLVMDYSDGGSLREILDVLPDHRLDPHVAARILSKVCAGLHAAHELIGEDGEPMHVVHRDVSPQNVLIATNGQVRITDFGVAKARGQLHAPTQTGEVKGKLSYMAPEQVTTRDIDRRADIFALGCVLYEATVGERPYAGGDALATLYQLLEEPLVPPSARLPGYPPELEQIVIKAMERDRENRYATAEDLSRALERFLMNEKARVSDGRIAEVVKSTLSVPIARRADSVADAIRAIEESDTEPVEEETHLIPSARQLDERTVQAPPELALELVAKSAPGGPTLSGTALPQLRPSRTPRLLAVLGAAVVVVGLAFAFNPFGSAANVTPAPSATAAVAPPAPKEPEPPPTATTSAPAPAPTPSAEPEAEPEPPSSAATGKAPKPVVRRQPAPKPTATATATAAAPPKPTAPAGQWPDSVPMPTARKVRTLDEDNPFKK